MPSAYGPSAEEAARLHTRAPANGGIFAPVLIHPTGSWPEGVAGGAWTGDTRGDALLTTSFDWDPANDHRVHLFGQESGGTLTLTQSIPAGEMPTFLTRGDFNHDGLDDAAVVNQSDDTIGVFLQNPGGGLGTMMAYPVGANPDGIATGDFNGDLRDDLAVTHALSQIVALYYQQPDGTFSAPIYFGLSSGGFNDLAAGDLNGDGYADLAVLRGAGHQSSQVAVFYQGNHTFGAPAFFTAEDGGFLAHGLAVGDVTGDGRADLVVTAGGNTPDAFVNIFVQDAEGTLAAAPVVYPAFHLPEAVEIGDVNHDGRNDIVTVHAAWMTLSVYTQTLTGTLSAYEAYNLPYRDFYRADSLALGDVTGDGALDALIANASSLPAENGLVVLASTGSAPTSTITIPPTGAFITGTMFTVQGAASADATVLEVSTDGGLTWQAQAASTSWSFVWTVPITDGYHTILARATNAAGQVQSPPAETRVVVDHTPPTGALLINNAAAYTNQAAVNLQVSGNDFNGLDAMHFANQGAGYTTWLTYTTPYSWTLSGADGLKTVTGQVRDFPGNISAPFSDTIILDTTPPSCGVLIDNDAAYANATQVTLNLSSSDTNGVAQMRARNAGDSWSTWQVYGTSLSWNLTGGDGTHTVEAQFQDVAGNISSACSDTIILDTTPPTCSIVIDGGAAFTNQTSVTLTLSSSDINGVSQMRFSDDGAAWAAWESYTTTAPWTLPGPDGLLPVYAQFQDAAGNDSAACQDDITLDTTPPTGFILINGGALYTGIPTTTLTLGASDIYGVSQMRFSDDGSAWTGWQAYAASQSWILPSGDGLKTVYVEYLDQVGNTGGPFTDTITLDTTPPGGAIVINGGATYTAVPTVTLTITATDEIPVTEMRLSHDGANWTAWETYAASHSWVLQAGDGMKTVYVQFRDAVNNTSAPFADAIVLDTTPPGCALFINGSAPYAIQETVTLNVSCADVNPPMQVHYSNDGANWSAWEPYSAVLTWTLSTGDGLKTVYLEAKDVVDNVGGPFTDTITLDTTPPACTFLINNDDPYTTSPNITLGINCSDPNGVNDMHLSDDGINWGTWQAYATTLPWTLPVGEGQKTVHIEIHDVPGNITLPITDTIILDTIFPSGGCDFQDENGYVNNPNVNLLPWAYDDNGVPDMQVRAVGDPWGNWVPFAMPHPWTLPGGDGEKSVNCRYRDAAGNVSPVYTTTVVLDTVPPTCDLTVNGGEEYVNDLLVTLTISSTDLHGVDGMRFSNDAASWSSWEPFNTSRSWTLDTGDGLKTVWGQFRDPAVNIQQCSNTITLDTAPPVGEIVLAEGEPYTAVPTVTVALSATDATSGVSEMCLSADGAPCNAWQPYQTTTSWALDPVDGLSQEVCVWFRDFAQNTSPPVCDTVVLDSIAPTGAIIITDDTQYTTQVSVTLTLAATDATSGPAQMRLSHNGIHWEDWQPYTTAQTWILTGSDGVVNVYVQYQDGAGNISQMYADTIMLDREAPSGSLVIENDAPTTEQTTVTLSLTAQDLTSGVCEMQIRNAGENWETWLPFTDTTSWTLAPDENGAATVDARFRDCAGNESATVSDDIEVLSGNYLFLPLVVQNAGGTQ